MSDKFYSDETLHKSHKTFFYRFIMSAKLSIFNTIKFYIKFLIETNLSFQHYIVGNGIYNIIMDRTSAFYRRITACWSPVHSASACVLPFGGLGRVGSTSRRVYTWLPTRPPQA